MEWKNWGVKGGVAIVLMAAIVGCAPIQPSSTPGGAAGSSTSSSEATAGPTAEATAATVADSTTYDDPFAYCAAVGTVDTPAAPYVGEELPVVIVEGIRDALDANDVALEEFQRGTVWRCLDGKVYACNVGANLPCLAKADESREPTQGMIDFCKENAGSDYIPAVVTGRETVYNWRCDDTEPVVVEQFTGVDSQGFLEFVWYELTQPE